MGAEVVDAHEEDAHNEEPGDHGEGDPVVPHVLVGCQVPSDKRGVIRGKDMMECCV